MTQAPTPGPLSKSLGQKAYEKMRDRNDNASPEMNDTLVWEKLTPGEQSAWEKDAKKRPYLYGLAPTAPVEASGSERERIARAIADGFSNGNEQYDDADADQKLRYDMAADAVLNLRLQPSGETREAVAARIRRLVGLADADFSFDAREAYVTKETDAILALLSARPLALGGQQGGGEAERQLERLQSAFPKAVENGVGRGMALAAAMIAPSDPVIAEQVLHESALTTEAALRALGVMEYDIKKLKPVLRNISERKSA